MAVASAVQMLNRSLILQSYSVTLKRMQLWNRCCTQLIERKRKNELKGKNWKNEFLKRWDSTIH